MTDVSGTPTSPSIELLFTGIPGEADSFLFGAATVALVRAANALIIFDTGPYAYRPILQERLRRAGIDPGAVTTVILSHLHWDNAANADLFTNAEVLVHQRELDAAEAGDAARDSSVPEYTTRALKKLRLRPLTGEMTLAPDVHIVELFGHTPGSIGLSVGRHLLAGDAIMNARDAIAIQVASQDLDAASETTRASACKALQIADVIYPGHDRPFHVGPPLAYVSDIELKIRLFTDPAGQDQELHFGASAARSFATWIA
jgi:N-acyl homoserine lactone hydrolase